MSRILVGGDIYYNTALELFKIMIESCVLLTSISVGILTLIAKYYADSLKMKMNEKTRTSKEKEFSLVFGLVLGALLHVVLAIIPLIVAMIQLREGVSIGYDRLITPIGFFLSVLTSNIVMIAVTVFCMLIS